MIKAIKILIEILGWLAIAGGITLGGCLVAFVIYRSWQNHIAAFVIIGISFVIGAIFATKISIKYGTMEWLSGIRKIS